MFDGRAIRDRQQLSFFVFAMVEDGKGEHLSIQPSLLSSESCEQRSTGSTISRFGINRKQMVEHGSYIFPKWIKSARSFK